MGQPKVPYKKLITYSSLGECYSKTMQRACFNRLREASLRELLGLANKRLLRMFISCKL